MAAGKPDPQANLPEGSDENHTRNILARIAGVSPRLMADALSGQEHAPERMNAVRTGRSKVSVTKIAQDARNGPRKRADINGGEWPFNLDKEAWFERLGCDDGDLYEAACGLSERIRVLLSKHRYASDDPAVVDVFAGFDRLLTRYRTLLGGPPRTQTDIDDARVRTTTTTS